MKFEDIDGATARQCPNKNELLRNVNIRAWIIKPALGITVPVEVP
jgi:hypothetical protein